MGARDERAGGRWYRRSPARHEVAETAEPGRGWPKRRAPVVGSSGRSVAPLSRASVVGRSRSREFAESTSSERQRDKRRREERRSIRTQLHARTASRIRRGRRDKREREIEAQLGDWPNQRERERALFRHLLALFSSGLIPRASSVRASPQHRRRRSRRRSSRTSPKGYLVVVLLVGRGRWLWRMDASKNVVTVTGYRGEAGVRSNFQAASG